MKWLKRTSGREWSDDARLILARARGEALRFGHDYVGTEHILLGLVAGSDDEVGAGLLAAQGVDRSEVVTALEAAMPRGRHLGRGGELPYTSRAKKVLEYAIVEAAFATPQRVGAEQLLLGLLREENGIAAKVLTALGASLEGTRQGTIRGAAGGPAGTAAGFRMVIDDASSQSIYEQIVARVQEAVATGELAPGGRLPAVRRLADELDIAPGTVARAYGELERLGVVVTEGARGTRVAPRDRAASAARRANADTLAGLLRPVAVAAFHRGLGADDLRAALDQAMDGIFDAGS